MSLPIHTFGIYDVYTYKQERGKGFYTQLFYYSVDQMSSQGFDKLWLWLMSHNVTSINVHYKIGIRRITKILTETLKSGIVKRSIKDVDMSLVELRTYA